MICTDGEQDKCSSSVKTVAAKPCQRKDKENKTANKVVTPRTPNRSAPHIFESRTPSTTLPVSSEPLTSQSRFTPLTDDLRLQEAGSACWNPQCNPQDLDQRMPTSGASTPDALFYSRTPEFQSPQDRFASHNPADFMFRSSSTPYPHMPGDFPDGLMPLQFLDNVPGAIPPTQTSSFHQVWVQEETSYALVPMQQLVVLRGDIGRFQQGNIAAAQPQDWVMPPSARPLPNVPLQPTQRRTLSIDACLRSEARHEPARPARTLHLFDHLDCMADSGEPGVNRRLFPNEA